MTISIDCMQMIRFTHHACHLDTNNNTYSVRNGVLFYTEGCYVFVRVKKKYFFFHLDAGF